MAAPTFPRPVSVSGALLGVLLLAVVPIGVGVAAFLASVAVGVSALEWLAPVAYAVAGVAAVVAYRRRGWSWGDLGFVSLGRRGWHLLWQAPVALLIAAVSTAAVGSALLGIEPADAPATGDGSGVGLVAMLAVYVVVGPVLEEIAFRRFVFGAVEDRVSRRLGAVGGVVVAVLGSSALFAVIHVFAPIILWTFFLGVGCALLTRRHRSLWAGCSLHWLCNAIVFGVAVGALLG